MAVVKPLPRDFLPEVGSFFVFFAAEKATEIVKK